MGATHLLRTHKFPDFRHTHPPCTHGRQQGVQRGANAPPGIWKLWRHTVSCSLINTVKFLLAPSALAIIMPQFCFKHNKIPKIFIFALSSRKIDNFVSWLGVNALNFVLVAENLQKIVVFSMCKERKKGFWLKIVFPHGKYPGDDHACTHKS